MNPKDVAKVARKYTRAGMSPRAAHARAMREATAAQTRRERDWHDAQQRKESRRRRRS